MRPKTVITLHALERVHERLHLTAEEIIGILDNGITTSIGYEHGSTRVLHRLFYSPVDEQCFVAVQDQKNGEVVTILPPDFDNHCRVPLSAIDDLLIELGVRTLVAPAAVPLLIPDKPQVSSIVFTCYVLKIDRKLRNQKFIVPAEHYPGTKEELEKNSALRALLVGHIAAMLKEHEVFDSIFVQFGKKGRPERFNLPQ